MSNTYSVGDLVRHDRWGAGIVIRADPREPDQDLLVDFQSSGQTRILGSDYALKLERPAPRQQLPIREARPRVFIGSSAESVNLAYDVQRLLERDADVTVWTEAAFTPSSYAMEDLEAQLSKNDFAIMMFSPDDITVMRNESSRVARDNVVFELGLFIGRLGRRRCFLIMPRLNPPMHLPTDLLGIRPATYDAERINREPSATLGPPVHEIRQLIVAMGKNG